ncbi:MAG TPA: hypothetical protein VJH88_05680 [Candidatus Nanoarchaeia archaeon]|nr:hypothetical protein [Candidatus Nanoarchaeia archaeon]
MFKKGGLSLSISTIVAVVIAVVMLTAGVYFLMDFLGFSSDIEEGVTLTVDSRNRVTVATEKEAPEPAAPQKSVQTTPAQAAPAEPIVQLKTPTVEKDCAKDLSCDYYIVFVPLGNWKEDKEFEFRVAERTQIFLEITPFKGLNVGIIRVPLASMKDCKITKIDPFSASHHQKIKSCADKYADSIGVDYERAIGLSNSYDGGRAFFGSKVMFASLGFKIGGSDVTDRPGIVAHELGHTYDLCDEYSFTIWKEQRGFVKGDTCKNAWPEYCDKTIDDCEGNTPTHRDYEGEPVENFCQGSVHYSIMGYSRGAECGLDRTGGYDAYGDVHEE